MANETFTNTLMVEVEGTALPDDVKVMLSYAYVDDSRNLPDTFVLRFRDPGAVVLDKGKLRSGRRSSSRSRRPIPKPRRTCSRARSPRSRSTSTRTARSPRSAGTTTRTGCSAAAASPRTRT